MGRGRWGGSGRYWGLVVFGEYRYWGLGLLGGKGGRDGEGRRKKAGMNGMDGNGRDGGIGRIALDGNEQGAIK